MHPVCSMEAEPGQAYLGIPDVTARSLCLQEMRYYRVLDLTLFFHQLDLRRQT
jgi:hypothetical protein